MYSRNFGCLLAAVCLMELLLCCETSPANPAGTRIVNGQVIAIQQAPYIVQLRYPAGGHFCGGTLVLADVVVTAAHCFDDMPLEQVVVVGGANTIHDAGVQRRIAAFVKYDKYTKEALNGDLAILKLDSPMLGASISPIPLCSRPLRANELIQVSGWGHTSTGGVGSVNLRTIRIPLISREQCQASYGGFLTNNMMCALHANQDSCQGDSGGPAVNAGELCGIVSCGGACASGVPGIYTNVYELRSFIQNTIKAMFS